MRQATVTLLTLVIECKPNATAFTACLDTSDLLTRFLPSCGDFNCQVPRQSALGLTNAIAIRQAETAYIVQATVLICLPCSVSIALILCALYKELASCTSINRDVMLHTRACVLLVVSCRWTSLRSCTAHAAALATPPVCRRTFQSRHAVWMTANKTCPPTMSCSLADDSDRNKLAGPS